LFFLPQDKIAEFLHVDQRDVSKMIAVLKGHAVLTLVNEARYTEHRAAEYRLGGAWAANKLKVKSIEEQRAKLNAQKKILGL
jgi:hypothetical protein